MAGYTFLDGHKRKYRSMVSNARARGDIAQKVFRPLRDLLWLVDQEMSETFSMTHDFEPEVKEAMKRNQGGKDA